MFVTGYGWVPVDPADLRKTLFGHWEMNWMAYNTAHEIRA